MVLPRLNVPAPRPGAFPSINLGPPSGIAHPPPEGTNPSGRTNDPNTIEGRIAIRNQVREGLMTPELRALLTKEATGQTLSTEEQKQLNIFNDQVEVQYASQIGSGIPADVQRRLDLLASQNNAKTSGGGGGGGGGGARKAGGGAAGGSAHPAAGAGARPPGGAGAGRAIASSKPPKADPTLALPPHSGAGAPPARPTLANNLLRNIANQRSMAQVGRLASEEEYKALHGALSEFIGKKGVIAPTSDPWQHARDVEADGTLRAVAAAAWLKQYATNHASVAPGEVDAFRRAGVIDAQGNIVNGRNVQRVIDEAASDPNHPLNTYEHSWIGAAGSGQAVPLLGEVNAEMTAGGAPIRGAAVTAPSERASAQPTTAVDATAAAPAADIPNGLSQNALRLHPGRDEERPIWIDDDGRMVGVEPGGQLTYLGTDPHAFEVARSRQLDPNYRNQASAPAAPAPTTGAAREQRILSDTELAGAEGDAAARAAWQAQKNQDRATGQNTLSPTSQDEPDQAYIDSWKAYYGKQRDAGAPPPIAEPGEAPSDTLRYRLPFGTQPNGVVDPNEAAPIPSLGPPQDITGGADPFSPGGTVAEPRFGAGSPGPIDPITGLPLTPEAPGGVSSSNNEQEDPTRQGVDMGGGNNDENSNTPWMSFDPDPSQEPGSGQSDPGNWWEDMGQQPEVDPNDPNSWNPSDELKAWDPGNNNQGGDESWNGGDEGGGDQGGDQGGDNGDQGGDQGGGDNGDEGGGDNGDEGGDDEGGGKKKEKKKKDEGDDGGDDEGDDGGGDEEDDS